VRGVASGERVSLTLDDRRALAARARFLTAVVPEMTATLQVERGRRNLNVRIVGTTPDYLRVHAYRVAAGRGLTIGDGGERRRVAVLGAAIPRELGMPPRAIVGSALRIRGIPFRVVGVLAAKAASGPGRWRSRWAAARWSASGSACGRPGAPPVSPPLRRWVTSEGCVV
jgi:MacB-like periplasmic core domain